MKNEQKSEPENPIEPGNESEQPIPFVLTEKAWDLAGDVLRAEMGRAS